jgi:eukaryotic-like serine/threonine-protein kinase
MKVEPGLVKSIFLHAVENCARGEWGAYLDQSCGENAELRRRVMILLDAHQTADSLIDLPEPTATLGARSADSGQAGTVIGPYKLLQPIGEGGMGTVYMAEQTEPVRRTVALKLIKAGMDSRQVLARFGAERQALALMDHPNIAKVFDAGTTDTGRPYFVMELVKGIPITKFCDERRLTLRERLELAIAVCQAVQHAHQKGIIHRDLKPSNVLIALYDGKPVPKVIDFGVAKATGPRLTDETLYTEFGAVVGTLEYMSPEQAELNQLDIDTRSDIYSLGVLLYELLTGSTPLEQKRLKSVLFLEVLRLIREEEPPRPSHRLSTTEELPSIAACRQIEPRKLSGLVRGELDWIVLKALEKDRNRRYETANGLAADLRRYLDDEPVQACPPSATYRLRKLARRNKGLLTTAALVLLALLVGTAIATWQAIRATRAQSLADRRLVTETEARNKAVDAERVSQQNERRAEEQELLARRRFYAAQINLANQAWQSGTPARTLELLEGLRPRIDEVDPRTFEWYYLWKQCHPGAQRNWRAEQGEITSLAFSPDGRLLAVGGWENVKLWDAVTGAQRAVFQQMRTMCLCFSPDGQSLVVGGWPSAESGPRLWDVPSGRDLGRLPGLSSSPSVAPIVSVGYSHDGKTIVAGTMEGRVFLWDATTRQLRKSFLAHKGKSWALVAFCPDDTRLVTASWFADAHVRLWDVSGDEPRVTLEREGATGIVFSPDGRTLAAGNRLLAYPSCELKVHLPDFSSRVNILAFSPDGKTIAAACLDRMIRLFDVATGAERLGQAHTAAVSAAAFSPDGRTLATATQSGNLKLWDLGPGQNPRILPQPGPVRFLSFSQDGRSLAVSGQDQHDGSDFPGLVLEVASGRELMKLNRFAQPGVLSPDWSVCATQEPDGSFKLSDARTGGALATLPWIQKEGSRIIAFSPDGKTLSVYWNGSPAVQLWDVASQHERAALHAGVAGVPGSLSSMVFSPDGKTLAAGSQINFLYFWNLASGEELMLQDSSRGTWIRAIAFSADGRLLAAGNDRGVVQLWEVAHGRQWPATCRGHTDPIACMTFTNDGQTLVTSSQDRTVRFWDVQTGQERMTLTGHAGAVLSVQLAPDGQSLATGGEDRTVRFWLAATDEMARAFRNELDPTDAMAPRAGNSEGDNLSRSGRNEDAAAAYQRALARADVLMREFPDNPVYVQEAAHSHLRLGFLLEQSGALTEGLAQQKQAIQLLDEAESRLAAGPRARYELAEECVRLAHVFLGRGQPSQEEAACRQAIQLDPTYAEAHSNLGAALYRKGQLDAAIAEFREAVHLKPDFAGAHNNLAWALATCTDAKLRDSKQAVELAKKAVELAPKQGDAWNTLGVAQYRASDWKAAIETLTRSMELRSGGGSTDWFFLAMAHWQLGDKLQARSWFDRAIPWMDKNQPKNEELIRFRAEAAALLEVKEKKK